MKGPRHRPPPAGEEGAEVLRRVLAVLEEKWRRGRPVPAPQDLTRQEGGEFWSAEFFPWRRVQVPSGATLSLRARAGLRLGWLAALARSLSFRAARKSVRLARAVVRGTPVLRAIRDRRSRPRAA